MGDEKTSNNEKRVAELYTARCVVFDLANDQVINGDGKGAAILMHSVAELITNEILSLDPDCFGRNANKIRVVHKLHKPKELSDE